MKTLVWGKKTKRFYFSLLLLLFLMITFIEVTRGPIRETYKRVESNGSQSTARGPPNAIHPSTRTSTSYEPHSPIYIDGNTEFIAQASAEDWPGEGTSSSPYIIAGFRITALSNIDLIIIRNTDVYLRINNCLLDRGRFGIYFRNSKNAKITENTLRYNSEDGIIFWDSENITISGNTVTKTGGDGIYLQSSGSSDVSNNIITHGNRVGISLRNSGGSIVSNNTVTNNSMGGISLRLSESSTLSGNTLYNNIGDGISLDVSSNNRVSNNIITNSTGDGISLWFSESSSISNNVITLNSRLGIYIYSSDYCTVFWNELIGNNPNGTSQAYDGGQHNSFAYNYWNEWIKPDTNLDGFVDHPYHIDGPASNRDEFPRTLPFGDPGGKSFEHIITSSIIIMLIIIALGVNLRIQKRK